MQILRGLLRLLDTAADGFMYLSLLLPVNGEYGWHKRCRMAIENPRAIASGMSRTSDEKEIMPLLRSTWIFFFLPTRPIENLSRRPFLTYFHSHFPKREKNFMDRRPGFPFVPGTPVTPLTNPFHLPTQMPQSWLPLIRIALSSAISFMVQHFSGLSTCSLVGITSPRMRCAVLTTLPAWSITSTEENRS